MLRRLVPARDLDLWAASDGDREELVAHLRARGAAPDGAHPYTERLRIGDRRVEVSRRTAPDTLEERLLQFDLALSAVGVEHRGGDEWRAVVHPLALEGITRREVRLLPELRNWRHGLASIERLRRYGTDLGFAVPPEEEARLWSIFDAQDEEGRRGMVERYRASGRGDPSVVHGLVARGVTP